MSRTAPNRLTVRGLAVLRDGVHGDGGNLWITIDGDRRAWSIRYKSPLTAKRREMGIGSAHTLTLAMARQMATAARQLLARGLDPIEQRKAEQAARRRAAGLTFEQVAERYIQDRRAEWRDPRSEPVWASSLKRLAYPVIGPTPVAEITTDDVLAVLRPIWSTTTETADRLRTRMERILDYATTHAWREGENPARWRGHLSNVLPKPSSVATVRHHPAVARSEIAAVMAKLAQSIGVAALAVRFVCLTAARSGEARGAMWAEIDLEAKVWTVPAKRMKGGREHRVPLSAGALAVLTEAHRREDGPGSYVFPGGRTKRPLSDVALSKALHSAAGTKEVTVHGLRSTFRDWVAEATDYPRDVAEMALAHAIGDRVEAAYRRGDLFEKRRGMMEEWSLLITVSRRPENSAS